MNCLQCVSASGVQAESLPCCYLSQPACCPLMWKECPESSLVKKKQKKNMSTLTNNPANPTDPSQRSRCANMSTVQGSSQADSVAETTCHEEAEINRHFSTTKRVLRKRRPTFSPHQKKHRIFKKHTPLTQLTPTPLNTLHDNIQTAKDHFIVHIDDKITQTKKSMRALITEKCNHFETQIHKLHALIADLQSENTQLKKKTYEDSARHTAIGRQENKVHH